MNICFLCEVVFYLKLNLFIFKLKYVNNLVYNICSEIYLDEYCGLWLIEGNYGI